MRTALAEDFCGKRPWRIFSIGDLVVTVVREGADTGRFVILIVLLLALDRLRLRARITSTLEGKSADHECSLARAMFPCGDRVSIALPLSARGPLSAKKHPAARSDPPDRNPFCFSPT